MYNNINNIIPILAIILLILCIIIWYKKSYKDGFTLNAMDKINGVIYINLDNREDRKKLIMDEMAKMGIPPSKIHKVSGIYIPKNGHKGCVQSHILALNIAKMNNWDTALILEDDAELNVSVDDFNKKLNNIFTYLENKEWDVIMIGKCNTVEKETINEFIKLKNATCGTGYIIKKHYYNKLLDLFVDCNNKMIPDKWGDTNNFEPNALDQRWKLLQEKDNWYGFKKDLLKQRNIWSTTNDKGAKIEPFISNITYNVYCFWTDNNMMSDNRKLCLDSIYKNIGVNVILITPKNLNKYILESHPLHPGYKYLSSVHKSDYLRTYFMHHYGGGYTDIKMTNTNWTPYFNKLYNTLFLCLGYPEVKGGSSTNINHKYLIGNCAYIFKPNTVITNAWYSNMIKTMDNKYLELKQYPANNPRDYLGSILTNNTISKYPLRWAELLCDNMHPVIYKYKKYVLYDLPLINTLNYK